MPKLFAFVVMPFDRAFDDIYKLGIQAVAAESDVVAERVDEQSFSETMLERIYRQIETADFIIADMTGRNENVFYEVGYAHAKGKMVTLLTQRADDIPFDLKQHRHLIYGNSIQKLKELLVTELTWLKREVERRQTNTFAIELRKVSADWIMSPSKSVLNTDVSIQIDIHNRTDRRTAEIDAMYFHTGPGWSFTQNGGDCPSTPSETAPFAIRHFVTSPVNRLGSGHWAQIKLIGRKRLWTKWEGQELQDTYKLVGVTALEIATSEGVVTEPLNLEVEVEEFPF